jgi:hypothetical protein
MTLDSFFKEPGGTPEYDQRLSICYELPETRKRIIEVRQKIWALLNKDQIRWPNDKQEQKINQKLLNAKDFGGKATGASFLPALCRFTGDFYQTLGDNGKRELLKSKHHFLIISACYGILKPTELIQDFACQFGIPPNASFRRWISDKNITKILIEYLKIHKIERIFDFTQCAVPAYQKVISWDLVFQECQGISVYHAYTWLSEDRSLRLFAEFVSAKMLASSEEDLLKIEFDREYGEFKFNKNIPNLNEQIASAADPIDLILESEETDLVEFKQCAFGNLTPEKVMTLRTNHDEIFSRIIDCKKIAKTLCAFMNSDGGDLFIGVGRKTPDEKYKITGIDSEMTKVGAAGYPKNPDGYERLIQDGIINVFIPEYNPATKCIKITSFQHKGVTICWIKVKPSKKPVFMRNFDGNNEDIFYIRDNSESKSLNIRKTGEYILVHFCQKQ